jgi:hypothetical protein
MAALSVAAPALGAAASIETLYEAYVACCVVEALSQLGATCEVRGQNDQPSPTLVFRTKPGVIYSQGPYTFIFARIGQRECELHTDLRVVGRSRVLHEIDVVLLDRAEGLRCRQLAIHPKHSKAMFLAECKFYGGALPLRIGREFVGLVSECQLRTRTIVSNVASDNVRALAAGHKATANFTVSPMSQSRVDEFVSWITTELRQVLG